MSSAGFLRTETAWWLLLSTTTGPTSLYEESDPSLCRIDPEPQGTGRKSFRFYPVCCFLAAGRGLAVGSIQVSILHLPVNSMINTKEECWNSLAGVLWLFVFVFNIWGSYLPIRRLQGNCLTSMKGMHKEIVIWKSNKMTPSPFRHWSDVWVYLMISF